MSRDFGYSRKVYSPDLRTFSLEGKSAIFGTVASIFVGPIRIILRVLHNIMILPANLMKDYANSLFIVGIVFGVIGVVDFILFSKWPLIISQVPVIGLAIILKRTASKSIAISEEKREVEIDMKAVEDLCNTIYSEIDSAIGKEIVDDE